MKNLPDGLPREPDHHVTELEREELYDLLRIRVSAHEVRKLLLELLLVRVRDFVAKDFEFVGDEFGVVLSTPF
jgi:hypothetical protein